MQRTQLIQAHASKTLRQSLLTRASHHPPPCPRHPDMYEIDCLHDNKPSAFKAERVEHTRRMSDFQTALFVGK